MTELNLSGIRQGYEGAGEFYEDVMNAVDLASDQDTITYLVYEGRRIAAIVPVDVAEHYLGCMGEVAEHVNQVTSAGRAMRGCRECGLEGTHKMGCSRR